MHVVGRDMGIRTLLRVQDAFPCPAAGSSVKIPLEKMPWAYGRSHVHVLGIVLRLPTVAQTIPAGKILDGTSVSQLVSNVSLRLAGNAPPNAVGYAEHFAGLEGFALFNALAFVSGVFPYIPQSDFPIGLTNTDVAHASSKEILGYTWDGPKRRGWSNRVGPFGKAASGGTASWTEQPIIYLGVGKRRGSRLKDFAVPSVWYSGAQGGCDTGSSGSLEFTLQTTMDNTAVTWTTAENIDIMIDAILLPEDTVNVPPMLRIEQNTNASKQFTLPRGMHQFVCMYKSLSSGAEQSVSHTNIKASVAGVDLVDSDTIYQRRALALMNATDDMESNGFHVPLHVAEAVNGNTANTARYNPPMQPLFLHSGSLLLSPGSAVAPIDVSITSTAETSYNTLDAFYVASQLKTRDAALQTHAVGRDASVKAATEDGQTPTMAVSNMLPQKLTRK